MLSADPRHARTIDACGPSRASSMTAPAPIPTSTSPWVPSPWQRGCPTTPGEVIFATARTVGWMVHALDEYAQPPLRLRPVGRYVGP